MGSRQYHRDRERQCREMADQAADANVREAHMVLAQMHRRLAEAIDEDEDEPDALDHVAVAAEDVLSPHASQRR